MRVACCVPSHLRAQRTSTRASPSTESPAFRSSRRISSTQPVCREETSNSISVVRQSWASSLLHMCASPARTPAPIMAQPWACPPASGGGDSRPGGHDGNDPGRCARYRASVPCDRCAVGTQPQATQITLHRIEAQDPHDLRFSLVQPCAVKSCLCNHQAR